jgi:hypothetical protein
MLAYYVEDIIIGLQKAEKGPYCTCAAAIN